MAIVAHYITKAGCLGKEVNRFIFNFSEPTFHTEELLIDFRELEGEHSGANLAEATWDTLARFGIKSRVS